MIPRAIPTGTTLTSFFERVLPDEHRALVPDDAGSAEVGVRLTPGPTFLLSARGRTLVVSRHTGEPRLVLAADAETAERFLEDWMGPRLLAPAFAPKDVALLTDPRLVRRVAMVTGSIELVLSGHEGGRATLRVTSGKKESADPDVTVEVAMPVFRDLLTGRLGPEDALGDGHVRVSGKKLVALQFALAVAPYFPGDGT